MQSTYYILTCSKATPPPLQLYFMHGLQLRYTPNDKTETKHHLLETSNDMSETKNDSCELKRQVVKLTVKLFILIFEFNKFIYLFVIAFYDSKPQNAFSILPLLLPRFYATFKPKFWIAL